MGHFFDPWRVFSDFLIICATDMQMCMHLSLLRPGVCREKGGGGGPLVQIPPLWVYGWQPQRRQGINGGRHSCVCVYCGDVMVCDGGMCDCVAVMDDVRPVSVVHICIMVALWRDGANYT